MAKKTNNTRQKLRQAPAKKSPQTAKAPVEALTQRLTKPDPPTAEVIASETDAPESPPEASVEAPEKPAAGSEIPNLPVEVELEGSHSYAVPFEVHFAAIERVKQLEEELEALRHGDGEAEASDNDKIAKHRRCPICWERQKGAGQRRWQNQVSGRLVKRCYRCDECGTEWVVEVTVDEVDDVVMKSTRVGEIRTVADGVKTEGVA